MPDDLSILECLINKLNYGVLDQLPATSGHIKSKQQTFTLIQIFSGTILVSSQTYRPHAVSFLFHFTSAILARPNAHTQFCFNFIFSGAILARPNANTQFYSQLEFLIKRGFPVYIGVVKREGAQLPEMYKRVNQYSDGSIAYFTRPTFDTGNVK